MRYFALAVVVAVTVINLALTIQMDRRKAAIQRGIISLQQEAAALEKKAAELRKLADSCQGAEITADVKPGPAGAVPNNSVFHKPKGAACPAGTESLKGYFTEKDGSTADACQNPRGDGSIDYINPGEGFTIQIPVVLHEPEKPRSKT
jgi:hypothetical protein